MQSRVLVRARGLAAFRRALVDRALEGPVEAVRRRVLLLPTRASAELLRQTLEQAAAHAGRPAIIVPDLLTRTEWIDRLHDALADAPPLLSRVEREVLYERAARDTLLRRRRLERPFETRPGLVAAMLDFHDAVKRRGRNVRRFARTLFDELRVERGTDRGSEGLIQQTCFLGFTFLAYERARAASGRLDEHALRARLLADQPRLSFDHLVVAVADHPSDPRGLWPADFDLAGRLRHLARIDVVTTDETHDAGFRDRLERELPGLEERRATDVPTAPTLVRPLTPAPLVFISRDREEEVRAVARAIRTEARSTHGSLLASTALVVQRPLPYVYMAQQVLSEAAVPLQLFDALPLAAEPYAALLDLVLTVARTGGTRDGVVALLRSGLVTFDVDGRPITPSEAAALEAVLTDRRSTGDAATYPAEVEAFFGSRTTRNRIDASSARRAAHAGAALCEALGGYRSARTASAQTATVATFLRRHERRHDPRDGAWARHFRARAAVLGALEGLGDAYRQHDDDPRAHEHLTAAIHHVIEAQTFAPRRGRGGVHVVDAVAARFGEFDHVYLLGLVESDWPDRTRRTIFYSSGLLRALGWPQEPEEMQAQQATLRDLMGLPRSSLRLSAFQLDGDAIVGLSPMIETLDALGRRPGANGAARSDTEDDAPARAPLFADELLTQPVAPHGLAPEPAAWLALRHRRPPLDDRRYHGFIEAQAARAYRVSAVDRYVTCPFKYFSEHVLGLPQEREEASGLTPIERGTLLHSLFERFYRAHGATITAATLPQALEAFAQLTRAALASLPEADRVLEETRLLGSIVGRGVAERVFELEADAGVAVATRLLEQDLTGTFSFPLLHGLRQRRIDIRGKADRIDILADGALRVVDYKLGRMPDLESSVQVAVYAHTARQMLEAQDGRAHPIASAAYVAFGEDRRLEGRLGSSSEPVAMAVEARAAEFAKTVERIEAGEFPAQPKRTGECAWCEYAGVCRKEYLVEDDEPVEAV